MAEIANLCVGICEIHQKLLICKGCQRTRLEIAKWMNASDTEKLAIIKSTEIKRNIYGDLNGGS